VDFTLCDYAADLRAPTPSAAAELAVRTEAELLGELVTAAGRLRAALSRAAESARSRLAELATSPVMARPAEELVGSRRQRLDELALRLGAAARAALGAARERAAGLAGRLEGLSPLAVLERGYSITCDADGRPLRSARAAAAGQKIRTRLCRGELVSRVEEVRDGQTEAG
jgi:exodeoxyribonuclease VII large subunit